MLSYASSGGIYSDNLRYSQISIGMQLRMCVRVIFSRGENVLFPTEGVENELLTASLGGLKPSSHFSLRYLKSHSQKF